MKMILCINRDIYSSLKCQNYAVFHGLEATKGVIEKAWDLYIWFLEPRTTYILNLNEKKNTLWLDHSGIKTSPLLCVFGGEPLTVCAAEPWIKLTVSTYVTLKARTQGWALHNVKELLSFGDGINVLSGLINVVHAGADNTMERNLKNI